MEQNNELEPGMPQPQSPHPHEAGVVHEHSWQLDYSPVDEIREYSCTCGASKQVVADAGPKGTTTTIRIFEPAHGDERG